MKIGSLEEQLDLEEKQLQRAIGRPSWAGAVLFLREYIDPVCHKEIRAAIAADPKHWVTPYHFFWGMNIRNALRTHGYGEAELGVDNLDYIYARLVEDALAF